MNIIKVQNVTKKFNENIVFENLNFSVKKGEIVNIIGESGKGKTTLLRCLVGLEKVDSGTIEINGQKLVEKGKYVNTKMQNEILSNIGMVFQNYNLFPNLKVRQNLEVVCNDSNKIDELLNNFGLYEKQNLYPQNLSGGQQQRVAIIRTLLLNPKIILFDEPTSALDDKNRNQIIKLVNDLQKNSYTIIIVTHDYKLIKELNVRVFNI